MSVARLRRLWLLERLGALPEAFRVASAVISRGRADPASLSAVFERVLASHALFRAHFGGEQGTKVVFDDGSTTIERLEVPAGLPAGERRGLALGAPAVSDATGRVDSRGADRLG